MFAATVVLTECGRGKNYRNPDELQDYDSTAVEVPKTEAMQELDATGDGAIIYEEMVSNGKPSVVDFTATWCPPCRMMKPIFHRLAKEYGDKYNFITIDIDENPELANQYQIQAVPTFVFLDADGNEEHRIKGAVTESDFKKEFDL